MILQVLDITTIQFNTNLFNDSAHRDGEPFWLPFVVPHFQEIGIEVKLLSIDDIDMSKKWLISLAPKSWNWEDHGGGSLLDGFSNDICRELVHGNAYLIINHECESFTKVFYKRIHDSLANTMLPPNKVIYMVGAPDAKREYDRFVSDNLLFDHQKINIMNSSHVYKRFGSDLTIFDYDRTVKKEKKFLSLNRTGRDHRIMLVSLFAKYDLLDKGFVSMGVLQDEIPLVQSELERIQPGNEVMEGFELVKSKLPLKVDDIDLKINQFKIDSLPSSFYQKSYFSVVSSTFALKFRETSVGFTEKEIKPILYKHPFVIQNLPGVLKHLKAMGFMTFDRWFDESYDDEQDDQKRLLKLVQEIKRLSAISDSDWDKMLEEMYPVLLHNYNRLVKYNTEHVFFNNDLKNLLHYVN